MANLEHTAGKSGTRQEGSKQARGMSGEWERNNRLFQPVSADKHKELCGLMLDAQDLIMNHSGSGMQTHPLMIYVTQIRTHL